MQQKTIQSLIEPTVALESLIYIGEYSIHSRLIEWGYDHKMLNYGSGEYACDEDGDGFDECTGTCCAIPFHIF